MQHDEDLLKACLNKDPRAQETLYRRFAAKMFGVCLRFARDKMDAEDILQEGFIKVFLNLGAFRNEGSLEGWVRKTMINTAINQYKKNIKYQNDIDVDVAVGVKYEGENVIEKLSADELLGLIHELPHGYKVVFNLYIIDGFTHKEISTMLDISENTSKSQLSRARQALQRKLIEKFGK